MLETACSRFAVINHGCKVNRVESDAVAAALSAQGAVMSDEADADLIVVNTCTVTGEADKKARKAVRHACKVNPRARIIVTGCAVAIDGEAFASFDERVEVVQRAVLLDEIVRISNPGTLRFGPQFRTRVNIKIQDGCDHACTYCIVHVARGKARSVLRAEVLDEARGYLARGAKELVLTGIDLASYMDGSFTLANLVESLLEEADKHNRPGELPARIRASSIEPHTLSENFIDLLAGSGGRLCRHLHLPLQSGSSKVLGEMARPYDARQFADLVAHLRNRVPGISLTTDVIVGFPGETDDEFMETYELARACGFSKMHVFPYSMRKGTPAALRPDQVDPLVKAARAEMLRKLSEQLRERDYEKRIGTVEQVLVEPDVAVTESYHEIPAPEGIGAGTLVACALR